MKLPSSNYSFPFALIAQLDNYGTAIMLAGVLLFTGQSAGVHLDTASLAERRSEC